MSYWEPKLKNGGKFDETASALQKAIRRGLEYEAMWYALDLAESGYDFYVWKRLCIIAVEDVGLAKPECAVLVNSLAEMWERLRKKQDGRTILPETNILALAIVTLCRAPKNRCADDLAFMISLDRAGDGQTVPIFPDALDWHTEQGKKRLRAEAKQTGKELFLLRCEEFYYRGGRLNKPTVLADGPNWSHVAMARFGCDYMQYYAPWPSAEPPRVAPSPQETPPPTNPVPVAEEAS